VKKYFFILLLIFSVSTVFAADFSFSFGGGGLLGYTFTRYTLEGGGVKSTQEMDRLDYGGFIFFDATYAVLSVIIQSGYNSYAENMIKEGSTLSDSTGTGNETSLGFSLMGKYPITVNEKFSWFPLLGIEWQIALIQRRHPDGDIVYDRTQGAQGGLPEDKDKDGNSYSISVWNSLWVNIGAGIDYIIGPFFLRSELFFGFRLPTNYESGALEVVKSPPINAKDPKFSGLTGGPTLKLGIGYQF